MLRRGTDEKSGQRPNKRKGSRKARELREPRDARRVRDREAADTFVLYVEGPRDREILACWARRIDHELARSIERHAVILGGRRPARAISDFRKRGGGSAGRKGLIVLDRDHHDLIVDPGDDRNGVGESDPDSLDEGLETFVWSLRHIESYLLVPAALRRMLGLDPEDRRIERFVEREEHASDSLHAKRILGPGGSLSEALGSDLRAGEIARAMRREDFHEDIDDLFGRIGRALGGAQTGPEVVIRSREKS